MSLKKHPDYREEVKRLDITREQVKNVINTLENDKETYQENIKDAFMVLLNKFI